MELTLNKKKQYLPFVVVRSNTSNLEIILVSTVGTGLVKECQWSTSAVFPTTEGI